MGTWSTDILGSDEALDTYNYFKWLVEQKKFLPEEIKLQTIKDKGLASSYGKYYYDHNGVPAFALACWEHGWLDEFLLTYIKTLAADPGMYDDWEDLADERQQVVKNLFTKISAGPVQPGGQPPRTAAAKPGEKLNLIKPNIPFKIGDCVIYIHPRGAYTGFVVVDIVEEEGNTTYYFGFTRIMQIARPTVDTFLDNHLMVFNYTQDYNKVKTGFGRNAKLQVRGYSINHAKNEQERKDIEDSCLYFEIIGNLKPIADVPYQEHYIVGEDFKFTPQHFGGEQYNAEKEKPKKINLKYPVSKFFSL